MDRKTALAVVTAATALLAAGSVAAVAALQATALTQPVSAVSASDASAAPLQIAGPDATLPAVQTGALPAVTIVQQGAAASSPQAAGGSPAASIATLANDAATQQPAATSSPASAAGTPAAASVTQVQAKAAVLAQVKGTVMDVTSVTRGGYEAWRVEVKRADGSVVAGIVDKASGVVFAWDTVSTAPAASYQDDDDDRDDDDDDDDWDDDDD